MCSWSMLVITRDRRRQLQERAVALVRLDDHVVAAPEPGVAAERAQPAADHRGRIQPGPLEHQRHHRRRRRLAVRAGDGDAVAQPHQLGEHLRARDHRDRRAPRLDHLRVVRRARPTTTTTTSAAPTCAASCPTATRTPSVRSRSVTSDAFAIRAAHLVSQIREQLGDAAHADAADADEVNAARPSEHHARRLFASVEHPLDDRPGRIRMRKPVRPPPTSPARLGSSVASAAMRSASRSPVSVALLDDLRRARRRPAPRRSSRW